MSAISALVQKARTLKTGDRHDGGQVDRDLANLEYLIWNAVLPGAQGSGLPSSEVDQLDFVWRLAHGLREALAWNQVSSEDAADVTDMLWSIWASIILHWAVDGADTTLYFQFAKWMQRYLMGTLSPYLRFPYGTANMPTPFAGPSPGTAPPGQGQPGQGGGSGGGGGRGGAGGGGRGGGRTTGGKKPHYTANDPPVSPTGHPNPPPLQPGNQGKVIGATIVRPNQQSDGGGGGIDWWLGVGEGGEGAIASEVQKWIQRGSTGPGSGPGGGPNPPSGHGLGQGPTGTGGGPGASSTPQQNPGYNTAHNADPYGGQGQETDRSQASRDSSDRQGSDATQRDQDGTPTTEDYLPDQDGTPETQDTTPVGTVTEDTMTVESGSETYKSGTAAGGYSEPTGGGSMPDPDSSDGGGSEGPSFTPGFHFTPHGGNTGRPIEQPPDPVDSSWSGFQQSSNPIAALLGLGGGGGDDWGGNNPHYDPAELADPETTGRYRGNEGYKPDPDSTGPSNPHSYSGKASEASRYVIATRASRLAASARSIRYK